jgi:hypothetical protein
MGGRLKSDLYQLAIEERGREREREGEKERRRKET